MAIRDDFEVVAGQVRVVLQRFALGLLVLAAFIAMLVGKADTVLVENARVLALDLASPALEAIARPVAAANRAIVDLKEFASLREENARLREENSRLLTWQTAARRLENENDRLRDLSQFREGPEASFITSRIVGDSVSAYVRGACSTSAARRASPPVRPSSPARGWRAGSPKWARTARACCS